MYAKLLPTINKIYAYFRPWTQYLMTPRSLQHVVDLSETKTKFQNVKGLGKCVSVMNLSTVVVTYVGDASQSTRSIVVRYQPSRIGWHFRMLNRCRHSSIFPRVGHGSIFADRIQSSSL